jgi:hypothetical protein
MSALNRLLLVSGLSGHEKIADITVCSGAASIADVPVGFQVYPNLPLVHRLK